MLPIRFKTETILEICTSPLSFSWSLFPSPLLTKNLSEGPLGGRGGEEWEREEFGCHDKINLIPYKAL